MALQGRVGVPLAESTKIFANSAQRPVKAPFLAQIDFSWKSIGAKMLLYIYSSYICSCGAVTKFYWGGGGGGVRGGGGGKLELLGEVPPPTPTE